MTVNNEAYMHRVDCILFYAISMIRDQKQALFLCDMADEAVDLDDLCADLEDIRMKVHDACSMETEEVDE